MVWNVPSVVARANLRVVRISLNNVVRGVSEWFASAASTDAYSERASAGCCPSPVRRIGGQSDLTCPWADETHTLGNNPACLARAGKS